MRKYLLNPLALAALLLWTASASAGQFFGSRPPEGWFWYELPPAPLKPEPPKTLKPPIPEPSPKAEAAKAAPATAAPATFSAAWLRDNLPKYLDRAVDDPSRSNVLAYMYLQRLAIDKSQRFADVVEGTVKTTPALDENTRRPLSGLGAELANQQAERNRNAVMAELSKRLGLWFFYSHECAYCDSQASILADLREIHGITVTAIAMDGSPAPAEFKPTLNDSGQARQLGITSPIAIVLVNPQNRQVVPISYGLLTRDQLTARILLAAHEAGWLSDDLYNGTRPMHAENLLTAKLSSPALEGSASGQVPISTSEILQRLSGDAANRMLEGGQ